MKSGVNDGSLGHENDDIFECQGPRATFERTLLVYRPQFETESTASQCYLRSLWLAPGFTQHFFLP